MPKWLKTKTAKTAIGGILLAVGGALTGTIDPATAVQSIVACVMAIFMRQGVAKSGK